jgi:hypothetical protein
MYTGANREVNASRHASPHAVLDQLSWDERVQLAELAANVREYNHLRAGTYMYRNAFCSLDSLGRPVFVVELDSQEAGQTSRRVVTFANADNAIEFVSQEMYFFALKSTSGLVKAQAWRRAFPPPATVSDETFELALAPVESHKTRSSGVLQ